MSSRIIPDPLREPRRHTSPYLEMTLGMGIISSSVLQTDSDSRYAA
nr:MAG TPA: hypothetical protein [Caudoviricetes sp.]DAO99260.1 MAG TPA: hypothetical protein [Caudoviricetes sp.]DAX55378.1 MAG TPA: hypothetical protein [Caudoviricetes sp.]